MKRLCMLAFTLLSASLTGIAQNVTIQVNASEGRVKVSPYIYGRNNNFSDSPGTVNPAADIALYNEAGLRFARENGGNNATKYNWRKKITSHPDWYNNVYSHNWDYSSASIEDDIPDMQTMWAFQLIGKVASNKNNNFNDWSYNGSQWWSGVYQNLAGGGTVNTSGGGDAIADGNPDLYLMNWTADSTTLILDHWFGEGGLGLDKNNFLYWSMDNEPEIWNGTHDDVMPVQLSASDFMEKYFAVAKKAREKFPEIKLTGPVPANEWQWFKWGDQTITVGGTSYCWLEYFIKRVAEEQKATGIRLLDVVDIHWYPSESTNVNLMQLHRVFFDKTYSYPGANGLKTINGGWDNTLTQEYIFQRINDWLTEYFGENHGITLGLTECDISSSDPNIVSVVYASILGTFANNGVGLFSPWTWKTGMWEMLHLFSRYTKATSVSTTSSLDATVSGYSTINSNADSMTIILVNRDLSASRTVTVNIADFNIPNGTYITLRLSSLPSSETFVSHISNALTESTVNVSGNSLSITLPSVSTTAVILKGTGTGIEHPIEMKDNQSMKLYPNPSSDVLNIQIDEEISGNIKLKMIDLDGNTVLVSNVENNSTIFLTETGLKPGTYVVTAEYSNKIRRSKLVYAPDK